MDHERRATLSSSEIESIIAKSVPLVVQQTLIQLGLDTEEPLEIQKDMQYVRSLRTNTEAVKRAAFVSVAVTMLCSGLAIIWAALKH